MKLKQRLEKHRDEKAQDNYWSSPSNLRPDPEAFKKGFDCAVEFLLAQKEIKNMEDIHELISKMSSVDDAHESHPE